MAASKGDVSHLGGAGNIEIIPASEVDCEQEEVGFAGTRWLVALRFSKVFDTADEKCGSRCSRRSKCGGTV